jgi:hypothetical protein
MENERDSIEEVVEAKFDFANQGDEQTSEARSRKA